MLHKILLARIGLARPPLTQPARDIAGMLADLESHLARAKDRPGQLLAARLHHALHQLALHGQNAGAIEVGTFSATPKPPENP